jgi:hypothetical protein
MANTKTVKHNAQTDFRIATTFHVPQIFIDKKIKRMEARSRNPETELLERQ